MACLIAETAIGEHLYRAARNWLSRLPGGLIVASIFGEAGMAAALGASGPTILAVGKVAVPEFERYKYNKAFSLGALTCGGVLGPLIPPSATMIIFSVLANVPLGRLFIAGVIPGILLAFMLSVVPVIMCSRNPVLGPSAGPVTWAERFSSLKLIWPIVVVMTFVLGSIYLGVATPTEAGGVGCFVVLIVAVLFFNLRLKGLYHAMVGTAMINAMVLIILVGASFLLLRFRKFVRSGKDVRVGNFDAITPYPGSGFRYGYSTVLGLFHRRYHNHVSDSTHLCSHGYSTGF